MNVPKQESWDEEKSFRFKVLAKKRAFVSLDAAELAEFNKLFAIRERESDLASADDRRKRYQRRKRLHELLTAFERYVEVQ